MALGARRITAYDPVLPTVLELIKTSFAEQAGRINPPSSAQRLTIHSLADVATKGELWALCTPLCACVQLTWTCGVVYIGKLAVAPQLRRQGLASRLLQLAQQRAIDTGAAALQLQSRVELVENHALFVANGFVETGRSTHAGFAQPTSISFRKQILDSARIGRGT